MAGTITLCLTQRPDAASGELHFYRAGTVSTPQNAFYDSALTLPLPNPYTLDTAGNIPFFYLADGSIKIVLVSRRGIELIDQDNIPVIGSSSGGGGGGTIDPTTVWQTGMVAPWYDTGVKDGFVRANGRTMGSAISGATERANADTQALFLFLYAADVNLSVSGGRGASAAADWAANKTITLPDFRGRVPAGLDAMGNSSSGRLTASYFGTAATVLGAVGGAESKTLLAVNLPAYTPTGTLSLSTPVSTSVTTGVTTSVTTSVTTTVTGTFSGNAVIPVANLTNVGGATDVNRLSLKNNANADAGNYNSATVSGNISASASSPATSSASSTATSSASSTATPTGSFAGDAQGGTSTPFDKTQPTILITIYLKL